MKIGARLRLIRQKNKLKLHEVGALFDITAQTLSRYENNLRTPDNDFLEAFGKHFKLSGDWLLYDEPPIYRGSDITRGFKESFLELTHLLNSKDLPEMGLSDKIDSTVDSLTEDIPENFLYLLKCMLKYPRVRKGIFQFFYFFQKPLIDEHPDILTSESDDT